jgi:hypothetical protein
MFLSAYHFDGDPAELLAGQQRLMRSFPPDALELNVCVERADGITIYDACPSRAVFDEFHTSDAFRVAVSAAGLPSPRIEPLGDVHGAVASAANVQLTDAH